MSERPTEPPRVRPELADEMKDQPPAAAVRAGRKTTWARLARAPESGAAVAAVLLYAFFALAAGSNGFTSVAGTASWLNTAADLGVIAVPVGLLMIAGELDLSTGSVVGVSSITIGLLNGYYHDSLVLSAVAAIAIGVAVGIANGLLVTKTRAPSFIVTLATNYILAGLSLAIAQSIAQTTQVPVLASGVTADIFAGQAGQFNVAILWWLVVAASGTWVLTRRRFGNWILATGGSKENARRAGVPTARVKLSLFVCTAAASALVGIMQAVEYKTGDATTGQSYVFQAPIVVVIGGVLLTGGYGSIVGVVLGTLIYGFVAAGVFYTGWNTNYAPVIIGVLMIIAVLTNDSVRALLLRAVRPAKER
jgi:simple sugar transport system permease protein